MGGGPEGETGSPGHGWGEGHVGSACPPPHVPECFCVGRQSRHGLRPSRTRRGHRSLARSFQRGPLGAAGRPGLWGMKSFSCGSLSQSARPGLAARRVWLCGQRYFQCLHRVCVSEAARLGVGAACGKGSGGGLCPRAAVPGDRALGWPFRGHLSPYCPARCVGFGDPGHSGSSTGVTGKIGVLGSWGSWV